MEAINNFNMLEVKAENIALILGKTETKPFNRYIFPILGRTVASYVINAAIHAEKIQKTYLSTDSAHLTEIAENFGEVTVIPRPGGERPLTDVVQQAMEQIRLDLGYLPGTVTILLANSPCVTHVLIDNVVTILEEHPGIDTAVTAMKRDEFSPERMFLLKPDNHLERQSYRSIPGDPYFLDKRVITTRPETITGIREHDDYFETMLGKKIYPVIQKDGIWDIDYIWQVPIVERWLKQNGFSETQSPYDELGKPSIVQPVQDDQDENDRFRVLITTVPFGKIDIKPLDLLEQHKKIEYVINPIGRKLKEDELRELIVDYDVVIAGTEPITRRVMENAKRLKLISRVGIGLDSVDLHAARELGIQVSYTPDGPSAAVAELTIAQMLNILRHLPTIDRKLRSGIWQRMSGERLANMVVGIIGTGRVGSRVLRHLQGFHPKQILVNDIRPDHDLYKMNHATLVEKETIYAESDIISLHIPLTAETKSLISLNEMMKMKKDVILVNTSRGGIINEQDLYTALKNKTIGGAALDVFEEEPYAGNLVELENCFFSCHMGSMTNDCRARMETEATEEAVRFINGETRILAVPEEEYKLQIPKL
jgi:D-3-phosphoglycerate dehydrogenase